MFSKYWSITTMTWLNAALYFSFVASVEFDTSQAEKHNVAKKQSKMATKLLKKWPFKI